MDLPRIVESLLFATDRPLTPKAIAHALHQAVKFSPSPETAPYDKTSLPEIESAIEQLNELLAREGSSLMVQGIAGGYVLKTRPEFAVWTNKLFEQPKAPRLSQPALETLAVIAYRQPIGRAEIESVRGVAVDGVVATLLDRKVIRIAGRSEQPGRPLLYETTPLFLELFGLKSLDELPTRMNCAGYSLPNPPMPPNNSNSTSTLSRQMQPLRQQVDRIDLKMLRLLQQRTKLSAQIGAMKRRHKAVIYVPEREHELIARLARLSKGKLSGKAVAALYREILSGSRAAQGQMPIGLLQASASTVLPASHSCFGACDQFLSKRTWPELARGLASGDLSLALLTADDLVNILTSNRWRDAFKKDLTVAGDFPMKSGAGNSLASRVFIITPRGNTPPQRATRIAILIECKSTLNAIKSLIRYMPDLSIHAEHLASRATHASRGAVVTLACLRSSKPMDGARAAASVTSAAQSAKLPVSILGIYLGTEDYGG